VNSDRDCTIAHQKQHRFMSSPSQTDPPAVFF